MSFCNMLCLNPFYVGLYGFINHGEVVQSLFELFHIYCYYYLKRKVNMATWTNHMCKPL